MWVIDKDLGQGFLSQCKRVVRGKVSEQKCLCETFQATTPCLRNPLSHIVLQTEEQWSWFVNANMLKLAIGNARNRLIPNQQFVQSHANALVLELTSRTLPVFQIQTGRFERCL